jgi:hypothetical protein
MKKIFNIPFIIFFGLAVLAGSASASQTDWEELDSPEEEVETGIGGTLKAEPTASPSAGTYTSSQSVTLSVDGAESIRYTTNGSTPTCSSTEYSSAISVSSTTTIKAISCYSDDESSDVATFTYTIDVDTRSPGGGSPGGGSDDDDEEEEETEEEVTEDEEEVAGEEEDEEAGEQGHQERRGELEQQAGEVEGELNNIRTRQRSLNRIRETINMLIGVANEQEKDDVSNALEQLLSRLDALEGRLDEEEVEKEGELDEIERKLGLISEIDRLDRMEETANALLSATDNESVTSAIQQFIERIEQIRERIEGEL